MKSEFGVKAVIVPVPSNVLVLVVVLTPVPPAVTVVVLDSCAKAVPSARALRAPAANIFVNLFCFMFVLWFG